MQRYLSGRVPQQVQRLGYSRYSIIHKQVLIKNGFKDSRPRGSTENAFKERSLTSFLFVMDQIIHTIFSDEFLLKWANINSLHLQNQVVRNGTGHLRLDLKSAKILSWHFICAKREHKRNLGLKRVCKILLNDSSNLTLHVVSFY